MIPSQNRIEISVNGGHFCLPGRWRVKWEFGEHYLVVSLFCLYRYMFIYKILFAESENHMELYPNYSWYSVHFYKVKSI